MAYLRDPTVYVGSLVHFFFTSCLVVMLEWFVLVSATCVATAGVTSGESNELK